MLTNSLAFHHLQDRNREFPLVRVWGTIGFIVPSWFILFYFLKGLQGSELIHAQGIAFAVSGVAGLVMSAYCLTLPHTPPMQQTSGEFAPGVVFRLLRQPAFRVLFGVTFFIAAVHNYYFTWNGTLVRSVLARADRADSTQAFTTIGQIAEIAAMALLALALRRFGFKRTMLLGGLAYTVRCLVLAAAGSETLSFPAACGLAAAGQALHGFCFAFFMAAAFIYLDRTSPSDVKGSVQTIYGTLVMGLGMVFGGFVAGAIGDRFSSGSGSSKVFDWPPIWLVCAAIAAACTVVFAVAFPGDQGSSAKNSPSSS
jgi:Na+/melibiose symporter-like transporter